MFFVFFNFSRWDILDIRAEIGRKFSRIFKKLSIRQHGIYLKITKKIRDKSIN